jgi:hypothetical protein
VSTDKVLGWDDEIVQDNVDQPVFPEGNYPFEIVNMKRGQHQPKPDGKGKLPSCPKAVVTIRVYGPGGEKTDIDHNLFLHSRCEGMLCAFFVAIGQRKHGEPLRPQWNQVVGSRGWCKLKVYKGQRQDGSEYQGNDIKSFIDPAKSPQTGSVPSPPVSPPTGEVPFDVPGDGGF